MGRFGSGRLVAVAVAAALGVGCDPGPPYYGSVAGKVTLDGQPVQEGVIDFRPVDGNSPSASAVIENGAYSARVPVNTHRVLISATHVERPQNPAGGGEAKVSELVPAKYNTKSELKAAVVRGTNIFDYDLKSK